jgi:hypothetical protein
VLPVTEAAAQQPSLAVSIRALRSPQGRPGRRDGRPGPLAAGPRARPAPSATCCAIASPRRGQPFSFAATRRPKRPSRGRLTRQLVTLNDRRDYGQPRFSLTRARLRELFATTPIRTWQTIRTK